MILNMIVLIKGSQTHVYIYIIAHARSELEAWPNSELHDHRGFKPRSSWLESTKRLVMNSMKRRNLFFEIPTRRGLKRR